MDKKIILKNLLEAPEVKDYTYIIFFLVIFAVFAFFIIKPALTIAFSLKREASDLKGVRKIYEENNAKLVSIQTSLEAIRDKVYLLESALPAAPSTRVLIDDIKKTASKTGVSVGNLNMSSVHLKDNIKIEQPKKLILTMETDGQFSQVRDFVNGIINQRRIKTVSSLKIFKETLISTQSGKLKVILEIEGYYL